jgi:hypothetical protein
MSACIIPVAPNFQDPPSVPISGPSLSGFSPGNFGELVTVPVPQGLLFSANVTDLDPRATLRIRWLVDYPPDSDATTLVEQASISRSADGQTINQHPITTQTPVDCGWIKQPLTSTHQLELVVADSDFLDSSNSNLPADKKLDSAMDPTGVAYAYWPIVISCPAGTTSNTSSP